MQHRIGTPHALGQHRGGLLIGWPQPYVLGSRIAGMPESSPAHCIRRAAGTGGALSWAFDRARARTGLAARRALTAVRLDVARSGLMAPGCWSASVAPRQRLHTEWRVRLSRLSCAARRTCRVMGQAR